MRSEKGDWDQQGAKKSAKNNQVNIGYWMTLFQQKFRKVSVFELLSDESV